jgi:MFS family permease
MKPQSPTPRTGAIAEWLGINRATLAVLIAIGGLGLSEEIWRNFFGIHLKKTTGDLTDAVFWVAIYAGIENLLEGFGYIIGGTLAHKLGARIALAASALPMAFGFAVMLLSHSPFAQVVGALLITNWEPLSVPATFEVVGSELPKNRRTIAFAVQSIQKRLPKVIGPLLGGLALAKDFWLNLTLSLGVMGVSILLQLTLLNRMKPKADPAPIPLKTVLAEMPADLRMLLTAEIFLRWGDWFVRDFASLYVVFVLFKNIDPTLASQNYAYLLSLTAFTALITYIPFAKIIDRMESPKPFIGLTFFLFALFPFSLVLLPKTGLPLMLALVITFVLNGLREIGEPARKALIASGFPPEVRARAVGLYWGLRSFAFFPAPVVAYFLWTRIGPDATFLVGGAIGMLGNVWFWLRVRAK